MSNTLAPAGAPPQLEAVIQPGNAPDLGKLMDLEMLMMPGGRERTEAEFRALFAQTGFSLTRIVPTKSPLSIIEAGLAWPTPREPLPELPVCARSAGTRPRRRPTGSRHRRAPLHQRHARKLVAGSRRGPARPSRGRR
ncbi:MAG: hypothetical protein GEU82_01115 [Luteitalea sp.]|nr:hypothetical protein [Luteitalea sp.]